MENLIVILILGGSLYYTGRRVYKQFKGEGCSGCDCSSKDSCSIYNENSEEKN